jgi:hypothetical protein
LERHPTGKAQFSEFELLLRVLFGYQWIRIPIEFSQDWANLFYKLTQGITDILVKLWESIQVDAIASGLETLTPELVIRVFAREFGAARFGLTALETKDEVLLQAVTDLRMPDDALQLSDSNPTASVGAPAASASLKPTSGAASSCSKPQPKGPTPAKLNPAVLKGSDLRGQSDGAAAPAAKALTLEALVSALDE